ncbi:MAG: hypothetical protein LUC93_00675 [Planctomycetaceae bacterium]|nr:hypothetical protein [Planctomycetaceae bacterium]
MNATFEMPLKVISEMNWRGHWAARHKRLKEQRGLSYGHCLKNLGYPRERDGSFYVKLTRLKGYRQRDFDGDNLQSSFKAIRDGIAQYLGIDDGSDRLTWEYAQEKGKAAGVRVEIREKA